MDNETSNTPVNGKKLIQIVPESILFKLESDLKPEPEAALVDDFDEKPFPYIIEEEGVELDMLVDEEMDKGGDSVSDQENNLLVGKEEQDGDCEGLGANSDEDFDMKEDIWNQRAKTYGKDAVIKGKDAIIRKLKAKVMKLQRSNEEKKRRIRSLQSSKNHFQKLNEAKKTPKESTVKCWVRDFIIKQRSRAWANFIMDCNSKGPIKRKLAKAFTEQEMLKAIGLRRISKKAYNYMRDNGLCPLPGKSTLTSWVQDNPQWGIPTIGEYVRPTVSKKKEPRKRAHEDNDVDAIPDNDVNPCGRCGKNFTSRAQLNRHLGEVHEDEGARKLQCKVCDKYLGSKENMVIHRNMHMDIKPFKCNFCERSYRSPGNMKTHRKEAHAEEWKAEQAKRGPKNSSPCPKCGLRFPFLSEFYKHLAEIHQDMASKELQCTTCDKWLSNKLKLQSHMRTHTGERPFVCDFCPKTFFSETSMYGHRRDSHRTEWEANKDQIEARNRVEGRRKQEARWAKMKGSRGTEGVNGEATVLDEETGLINHYLIKCEFCEKSFKTKRFMLAHQKEAHGEELKKRTYSRIMDQWTSANPCSLCGKDFPLQSALNEHLAQVHDDPLAKELQCTDCQKWFGTQVMLTNHVRSTHTGERPFKCDFCPKTFATNKNMGAHRKEVHHEEWEANKGQILARKIALNTAKRRKGNGDVAILDEANGMIYN